MKSRVARSPTRILRDAISRARKSMSARDWAACLRSSSCEIRSRASCRYWASRMSGAAYEACRLRTSVRNVNEYGSNRHSTLPSVFHSTHTTTMTVIHPMNRAVPMNRANFSANDPNTSESRRTVGTQVRFAGPGELRRSTSMRLPALATAILVRRQGPLHLETPPVLGQHVVEHVVDGHGSEQVLLGVDDRNHQHVVRREVSADRRQLRRREEWPQLVVDERRHQRGGGFPQQPLQMYTTDVAACRRLQRGSAHEHHSGERRN